MGDLISITTNSNNNINKQSLIADFTKYRNIKLVTKELGLKNKKLSKNILDLEHQKEITKLCKSYTCNNL